MKPEENHNSFLSLSIPTEEDEKLKLQLETELANMRGLLLMRHPFIALCAMHLALVPVVDCRMITACTDGKAIFVNAYFWRNLDTNQRLFLLAHEAWHCVLFHCHRGEHRDPELWNIAIDHEVNALLVGDDFTFIPGSVFFEWASGMNAEAIYNSLEGGFRTTDKWGGAKQCGTHLQPGDTTESLPYPPDTLNEDESMLANTIAQSQGKIDKDLRVQISRKIQREWRDRIIQAAQQAGSVPKSIRMFVQKMLAPSIPWQTFLWRFVSKSYQACRSWLPPSRRHIHQGLYLPSLRSDTLRITVALDTSGSTEMYLDTFFAELSGIIRSFARYELTLIQCDCGLQDKQLYTPETPFVAKLFEFHGGGGTDFCPIFENIEQESEAPSALLILTDGYGPAPKKSPTYPLLWVLTPDGRCPVSYGEMITISCA